METQMKKIKNLIFKVIVLSFLYTLIYTSLQSEELKIYSERQPLLIEPLLKEFEKDTGIKVEWIYSKKGLVQKIILELGIEEMMVMNLNGLIIHMDQKLNAVIMMEDHSQNKVVLKFTDQGLMDSLINFEN